MIVDGCHNCPFTEYHAAGTSYSDYDHTYCDHDDFKGDDNELYREDQFLEEPPPGCPLPDYLGELPGDEDAQDARILDLGVYSV